MDITKDEIKKIAENYIDNYLQKHPYKEMSNFNPIKPLAIWRATNNNLNEFYKRPEIGLSDNQDDLNIKNSMRHITGLANVMQEYKNPYISKFLGAGKEIADILRLDLDNKIDWRNNNIGIEYATKNPQFKQEDILKYAYMQALKNYKNNYGYEYPNKSVNGEILNDDLGQYGQGNIDLYNRPQVKNDDGSISTVRSMSFNDGKQEVLIPTISDDGKIMSYKEAYDNYMKTGKYLGKFNSIDDANNYAQKLHQQQQNYYLKGK